MLKRLRNRDQIDKNLEKKDKKVDLIKIKHNKPTENSKINLCKYPILNKRILSNTDSGSGASTTYTAYSLKSLPSLVSSRLQKENKENITFSKKVVKKTAKKSNIIN